ncbi:MAG TPA: hypothetical protein PK843_14180 [bacterium]|nr:hypothetical protein [bacterium]
MRIRGLFINMLLVGSFLTAASLEGAVESAPTDRRSENRHPELSQKPRRHPGSDGFPARYPLGKPGACLTYRNNQSELAATTVHKWVLTLGPCEGLSQWLHLQAVKKNGETFQLWLLCSAYPSLERKIAETEILRYIVQFDRQPALEFRYLRNAAAILPSTGAWKFLMPRPEKRHNPFAKAEKKIFALGHTFELQSRRSGAAWIPPAALQLIRLNPELLIGVPSNTRQKDPTRRYDESEYDYVRLTQADYDEMTAAGFNCFRVDADQVPWIQQADVYYWGVGGADLAFPEDLYRSNYIGPAIFFDEPMVGTRDRSVRPKLAKDPALRKAFTPALFLKEFRKWFHKTKYEEAPAQLVKGLAARPDVDLGEMDFLQQNLYSWETMVSSALYQLAEGGTQPPYAMVFEPPGRFGSRRILPELNMCFDCQFPVNSPGNLTALIYGFLRGAARVTDKEWGVSIYGAVDRADSFWFLTHAYDLGATLFFYWDNYQLACVPYPEALALTRHLHLYAKNFPNRDLSRLKRAAEVAILLPAGYNLGHVHMGRGSFSGLPELNMERMNAHGVRYRQIMSNFLVEVERCLRLGVEADLFWNLDSLSLPDYREIVVIEETGRVRVTSKGGVQVFDSARTPERPAGFAPQLSTSVLVDATATPVVVTAQAKMLEGSAPIFYTPGADAQGVYHNNYVLWELYGPEEEDYSNLWQESWNAKVLEKNGSAEVELKFTINRPGTYRLRAATADLAGRSAVAWQTISVAR